MESGAKRKAGDGEDTEREGTETRRLVSPTPMDLGTPDLLIPPILAPGRHVLPSLGSITGALNSTRLSDPDSVPPLATPTPSPPEAKKLFSSKPADRGRRGVRGGARRRTASDPTGSPRAAQQNARGELVHRIFPLDFTAIPRELRVGRRPAYPYPFTGLVQPVDRDVVRGALVRSWEEEFYRQIDPTEGSVARVLQLHTIGRWLDGWRRSRITGEWMFFGRDPSPSRLRSETQLVGRQRGEAAARVQNEEKEGLSSSLAERRAKRLADEAAERAGEKGGWVRRYNLSYLDIFLRAGESDL